jgi:hypothetical protein
VAIAVSAIFSSCSVERLLIPDGRGELIVTVDDTPGLLPGSIEGVPFYLDSTSVKIELQTQIFTASQVTNAAGIADFDHLDTGRYSVFARREIFLGSAKKIFTGSFSLLVEGKESVRDMVFVKPVQSSQLVINELYHCGSCASSFYFYDQFVELYNSSDDTLYLDGDIITRELGVIDPDMEKEDYVRAIYAFQFPGTPLTGRQYPIRPKQFMVLASNAVDLSHADWEFFNVLGSDYDNLAVPNLNSITDRTEEWTIDSDNHVRIPVKNVIDGVECNSNPAYAKEITVRIDAGFGGIGILRYSGYSTERRELGLDTNDSTFDFMNLVYPTPGYFHGQ